MATIDFEDIQPWNGSTGTGADARGVVKRNFAKVNQNFAQSGGSTKTLKEVDDELSKNNESLAKISETGGNALNISFDKLPDLTQGGISGTGVLDTTSTNRIRTYLFKIDFLESVVAELVNEDWDILATYYDKNKAFIANTGWLKKISPIIKGTTRAYIAIVFRKSDNSNITPSNFPSSDFSITYISSKDLSQATAVSEINEDIEGILDILPSKGDGSQQPVNLGTWELGTISSGVLSPSTTRLRTPQYISVTYPKINVTLASGYKCYVEEYNTSKGYIKTNTLTNSSSILFNSTTEFYRFVLAKTSDATIAVSESVNISVTVEAKQLVLAAADSELQSLRRYVHPVEYNLEGIAWISGTSLSYSGTTITNAAFYTSPFIPIEDINTVYLSGLFSSTSNTKPFHGYVNKTDTTSTFTLTDPILAGETADKLKLNIPPTVNFFRIMVPAGKIDTVKLLVSSNNGEEKENTINTQGIIQHKGIDITDYTGNYTRKDITTLDKDNSFPFVVTLGDKVMLSYFSRQDHSVNSWSGQRVVQLSDDLGQTFDTASVLPDGVCYTGAMRLPNNKVIAAEVLLDRTGASGYYEKSRPLVGDFQTLYNSNGLSGFTAKDWLSIPDMPTAQVNISSKIIVHKGVLYMCGYHNGQFVNINQSVSVLYRSTDNGNTWQYVSKLPTIPTGECSICFDKNRLIMCSRVRYGTDLDTENNWIHYSDDLGLTWTPVTMPGINLHNPYIFTWNNHVVCTGRLLTDSNYWLGFVVLNEDYSVKNAVVFDKSEKLPSYHQDYLFAGEYLRIFSHIYVTNNNRSKIFSMDIPLSVLSYMTNLI